MPISVLVTLKKVGKKNNRCAREYSFKGGKRWAIAAMFLLLRVQLIPDIRFSSTDWGKKPATKKHKQKTLSHFMKRDWGSGSLNEASR